MKFALLLLCFSLFVGFLPAQDFPEFQFEAFTDQLNNQVLGNNFIGGISGIAYDRKNDRYLVITDNSDAPKNQSGSATIYSFRIAHPDDKSIALNDINVIPLKSNLTTTNPESIRVLNDEFLISTEGEYTSSVIRTTADGEMLGEIYSTQEIRFNSGVEGICLTIDKQSLYMSIERPVDKTIVRGGAEENLGVIPVYRYGLKSKEIEGHFLYPLHVAPTDTELTEEELSSYREDNGVTEILTYNDTTLLFLERAFLGSESNKLHVRLYAASVSEDYNIIEGNFNLLEPTLLFDFYSADLPFNVDNIEGMAFDRGKERLYLISDDNFDRYGEQTTQVISLKVLPPQR